MQAYSTIKRKSTSDDGLSSPPPGYTIRERQTASDDGFASFPEYNRDEKIADHEDPSEGIQASSSGMQNLEDAQSHHGDLEELQNLTIGPSTAPAATGKKKRRKPITPKNKRKNWKGKARASDPQTTCSSPFASALASHTSPQDNDRPDSGPRGIKCLPGFQGPQEMLELWKNHALQGLPGLEGGDAEKCNDYLEGKTEGEKGAGVKAKVGDEEEFEFRQEDVESMGKYKKMTGAQQKREMLKLLEGMIE